MSGYGKNAAEYLAGEEYNNTPCTPGGCYDRLKEVGGKVLLVGVGHERNTYIHSVEEVLNVPNRLSDMPMELVIELQEEVITVESFHHITGMMAGKSILITNYAEKYM